MTTNLSRICHMVIRFVLAA